MTGGFHRISVILANHGAGMLSLPIAVGTRCKKVLQFRYLNRVVVSQELCGTVNSPRLS